MIKSCDKGKHGERELASILREHGFNCRRGQQYCGANGDADVIGLPGVHIEVKRTERLNLHGAMKQSIRDAKYGEFPFVFSRRNNNVWLVTMRLIDWLELYKQWNENNKKLNN